MIKYRVDNFSKLKTIILIMDSINIISNKIDFLYNSDDLFLLEDYDDYDNARYLKIFNGLFQLGFFIIMKFKARINKPLPTNINTNRDLIWNYINWFYNEKNCYYIILINFQKNGYKLQENEFIQLHGYMVKCLQTIQSLLKNNKFSKYSRQSKDNYISKVVTAFSIYMLYLKNNP